MGGPVKEHRSTPSCDWEELRGYVVLNIGCTGVGDLSSVLL